MKRQSEQDITTDNHVVKLRAVFHLLCTTSAIVIETAPDTDLHSLEPRELENVKAAIEGLIGSLQRRGMGPVVQAAATEEPFMKDIQSYQQAVKRTCTTTEREDTLKLALIGLQDELGEVAGPIKKYLWHGHPLDCSHIHDEVGDLLWYLATLCNTLGLSLADALHANIKKLHRRYPDGFSSERSLNRSV